MNRFGGDSTACQQSTVTDCIEQDSRVHLCVCVGVYVYLASFGLTTDEEGAKPAGV